MELQMPQNIVKLRKKQEFYFPEAPPSVEITLEKCLADTSRYGSTIYARQLLLQIDPGAILRCPQCCTQVTDVRLPNFDYVADVVYSEDGPEVFANLLAEHTCSPLPAEARQ